MPFQELVDTFQGKLTTYMLIAISKIPSFGPPARLHHAFGTRIEAAPARETRLSNCGMLPIMDI